VGRDEEAIAAGELTVELDPLSPFYAGWLAEQYRDAGRLDDAVTTATGVTEIAPRFPVGWFVLGSALADQGLHEQALAAHARLEGMPWCSSMPTWVTGVPSTAGWTLPGTAHPLVPVAGGLVAGAKALLR
jgi:hypothetical protein